MKKIVKPLAAVFAAVMVFSMMSFAFAAVGAKFSINLASETDSQVIIEVKLESGSFTALDFGIEANPAKVKACTKITPNMTIALEGAQASNPETGLFGCVIDAGFAEEGGVIATYTFAKVAGTNISKDDFELNISNCSTDFEVVNNIPVYVEPSTEETTEPSTEAPTVSDYTEPSTEESTEASTEESTEASTEPDYPEPEAPTTEPEHNFSEWYYIREATCTTPGLTIRYCKICNEVEFKAVDVLPYHNYESLITPPTCTEAGYVTYTCSCGDCYTEPYAGSLGHSFGKWIETKPATCTTKGEIKSSCSRCGETKTIETEVSDTKHTTGEWEVFEEATPFASGVEVKRCLYCEIIVDARSLAFKGGKIHSVSIGDISMSYKDSATITPNISVDAGVDYTVTYSSSNTDVVSIDANGKLTTNGTGDATITVTVIDQYGREVTDTCEVTVKYTFVQWIIVIVLFGWIWY